MKTIPLFPLSLVVFPGSKYPLHIFEERYKKLINKCIEDQTGFGIITKFGKDFSKVGCYVIINDIVKKYPGGEMDIIVEGQKRFYKYNITMHPDGYYEADIEDYTDMPAQVDVSLEFQLKERFEHLLEKFNFHLDENFWLNYQTAERKSFKIAEKSGLTIEQQQAFLLLQNENKRLHFLIDHFEKLDKEITKNAAIKSIVLGDGYLP